MNDFSAQSPFLTACLLALVIVCVVAVPLYWRFYRFRENVKIKWKDILYKNPTTGLHNIRWFKENAPKIIADMMPSREGERLYIMAVSIRHLALLKETYDETIIADHLTEKINEVKKICPWVVEKCISQELAVMYILCDLPEDMTPVMAAEVFIKAVNTLRVREMTVHLDYVVGVASIPKNHEGDVDHIIHAAAIAQTEASNRGEIIGVYDEKLHDTLILQRKMEDLMEKALVNEEFKVWLQPKYDILTRKVVGAEALVRWDSPELGFLMPGKFIGLFEKNGFAVQLDYYMLEQICRLQVKYKEQGAPILPISVNQSALHIGETGYLERMKTILIGYGLPPKAVDLELTETAFVDFNTKETRYVAKQIIHDLRGIGYATSMDDFCSGYSSITLLQNLPMETMKIDRALLLAAEKSPRAEIILKGVVALGEALEMKVICEGIETAEQEELLIRNGCRLGQGYLFAKPMPLEEYEKFVSQNMPESVSA